MKKNVSKKDRILRLVIAAIFTGLNVSGIVGSPENILLWIVAGIMVITALLGSCPLYSLFGINTLTGKRTV